MVNIESLYFCKIHRKARTAQISPDETAPPNDRKLLVWVARSMEGSRDAVSRQQYLGGGGDRWSEMGNRADPAGNKFREKCEAVNTLTHRKKRTQGSGWRLRLIEPPGRRGCCLLMPRRVVELEVEVVGGATSGGPIHSSGRRSSRRKSPYAACPPPTVGPSVPLGGMTIGSGPPSSSTRSRLSGKHATFDSLEPMSGAPLSGGPLSSGPLSRQLRKEAKWKAKLAREHTTWWDVAAMGRDGLTVGDPSSARAEGDPTAIAPCPPAAGLVESASHSSLCTLARGRNHARADIASVEQWRNRAVDRFLGSSGEAQMASDTPPPLVPTSSALHSPGHFTRKYGGRRGLKLPPLGSRSQVGRSQDGTLQREAFNAAMRARVFVGAAERQER